MSEYMAVSTHSWGWGNSIDEAKARCKKYGGNLNRVVVYKLPEEVVPNSSYVDTFGAVRWEWVEGYDGPQVVDLEIVYKRGVKLTEPPK